MSSESRLAFSGVILGAIISLVSAFGVQMYVESVHARHSAKAERALHIERAATASTNILASELAFAANWMTLIIQSQMHVAPDAKAIMPDLTALAEMRTVVMLYLPELKPDSDEIERDYSDFCKSFAASVAAAGKNYTPGGPFPAINVDQKLVPQMQHHVEELQKKLVELAKKNET
jgi:hypothetical protein